MGKLRMSAARLTTPGRRVGMAQAVAFVDARPWRAWYKTAEWRALRREVLLRDHMTCQRCRRICAGKYPADDSPVVDHKKPHRGDRALFFDRENLQLLCKSPCHDQVKQAEEQASRHQAGVWT